MHIHREFSRKEAMGDYSFWIFNLTFSFYALYSSAFTFHILSLGEELGNKIQNGKMMFIYQAQLAFSIWHNILPKVHNKLLKND